jgi:hypothetical protein
MTQVPKADIRAEGEASALWYIYWAVTLGSPWTFVTGGGFHLPVSASDFGP